jgi:hypothetical protein
MLPDGDVGEVNNLTTLVYKHWRGGKQVNVLVRAQSSSEETYL